MRRLVASTFAAAAAIASAASASTLDLYHSLRSAAPQTDGIAVHGVEITRDAAKIHFDQGEIHFLASPDGRIFGAVFVGAGSYALRPASPIERAHLALLTGDKALEIFTDRFDSLVLLFSDASEKELRAGASPASGQAVAAADAYRKFTVFAARELKVNLDLDVLRSLTDPPGSPALFLAAPAGGKFGSMLFAFDPGGLSRDGLGEDITGENVGLFDADPARQGFWYLAPASAAPAPAPPALTADRYEIDTRIVGTEIHGETVIHAAGGAAGSRVVGIHLAPKLRLAEAEIAIDSPSPSWQRIDFVQEKAEEDANAALLLDAPPPAGRMLLRLVYGGKEILFDAGDGNFAVRARESWYPNLGAFRDPATFDLTYHVPANLQIVSVGDKADEKKDAGGITTRWHTPTPVRVAGFNYGKFRMLEREDKASGETIAVYTNPGTPDIITEINQMLQHSNPNRDIHGIAGPSDGDDDNPMASVPANIGRQSVTVDTESLAQSALVDGINTARVGNVYFGKLPIARVAITQQSQWSFGQSWPGLIYLPYLAFLDSGVRHELGLERAKDFVEAVGPHELAHQWWGHLVGWNNYRDQWLSEGFAEFTAGLVLEKTGGPARARDFWSKAQKFIVETPRGSAIANCDAGPISLGWRLGTFRNPSAYAAIVYSKGAYVLRMLRAMMRDDHNPDPDHAFSAMMKDFASRYAGKNPSTADFQHVVEEHMVPTLNATGNGKADWFFKQWVDGTAIPRVTAKIEVKSAGGNKYELTGELKQEGVPDDFRVLMPLYVDLGKGKYGKFGVVPMMGNRTVPIKLTIELPQKPKAVVANALGEVLTRN
jgi:hypothetical protein